MIIQMKAVTGGGRNASMAAIRQAVQAEGGSVNSHELYSDIAAHLSFEIDGERIAAFVDRLALAAIRVAEDIGEYGQSGNVRCRLNITFVHADPDANQDAGGI